MLSRFQSTLPVRGATGSFSFSCWGLRFQSTLPVRGATYKQMYPEFFTWLFQSTLPVRGATMPVMAIRSLALFQSTLPVRGATKLIKEQGIMEIFQSTLPVRGATGPPASCLWSSRYFNPRSPYGERPMALNCLMYPSLFQSTLPVRGATPPYSDFADLLGISIHAPRTGSDVPSPA